MKFFDRESEIALLREIRSKANASARFTVVTGRCRVGKTQLIKRALEDRPYLHFYVARIDLGGLRAKASAFLAKTPELSRRQMAFPGLSLEDL